MGEMLLATAGFCLTDSALTENLRTGDILLGKMAVN
jgi:hypothetical protein